MSVTELMLILPLAVVIYESVASWVAVVEV